jgi:hypothetical protein
MSGTASGTPPTSSGAVTQIYVDSFALVQYAGEDLRHNIARIDCYYENHLVGSLNFVKDRPIPQNSFEDNITNLYYDYSRYNDIVDSLNIFIEGKRAAQGGGLTLQFNPQTPVDSRIVVDPYMGHSIFPCPDTCVSTT